MVLDYLEQDEKLFDRRLYRDSCMKTEEGVYIKDLRIFEDERDLESLVIVDNAVYSFGYQLENGIPIIPFYDDKSDEELLHLSQYLECLYQCKGDIRDHNRKAFQLKELSELDVQQFLQNMISDISNPPEKKKYMESSVINEESQEDDESSNSPSEN